MISTRATPAAQMVDRWKGRLCWDDPGERAAEQGARTGLNEGKNESVAHGRPSSSGEGGCEAVDVLAWLLVP